MASPTEPAEVRRARQRAGDAQQRHDRKVDVKHAARSAFRGWLARTPLSPEVRATGEQLVKELVAASVDEYTARRDLQAADRALALELEATAAPAPGGA